MKETFTEIRFHTKTRVMIEQANTILNEFAEQGFAMTLRQYFYQYVARGLLENTFENYKLVGRAINDARLAGLIDWSAIEDRARSLNTFSSWRGPESIINSAANSYYEDIWQSQRYRPEVWIEKMALIGVIEAACNEFRVPYFASIGNNSQSEQHKAGKRFRSNIRWPNSAGAASDRPRSDWN